MDAGEVVGLLLVVVPRLDDARVGRRAVDLAELLEDLVVTTEDLHQPAALVGNDVEFLDSDAVDSVLHRCHRIAYRDVGIFGGRIPSREDVILRELPRNLVEIISRLSIYT